MKVGALQLLSRLSSGLASTLPGALHLDQPLGMLVDDGAAAQSVVADGSGLRTLEDFAVTICRRREKSIPLSPGQKDRNRGSDSSSILKRFVLAIHLKDGLRQELGGSLKWRNEALKLCKADSGCGHGHAKTGDQLSVRRNDRNRTADDALHVFLIGLCPPSMARLLEKLQEGLAIHDGLISVLRQSE